MFVRWTEGWNLPQETHWWYIICEPPFALENLSKSSRRNVRNALRKCEVRRINPEEYMEDMWRVYNEAVLKYTHFHHRTTNKQTFIKDILNRKTADFWGGFYRETGQLIGYKICDTHTDYVSFSISKYSVPYLNLRVSDALNYTLLDYYLNQRQYKYILNGSRALNHVTNVQNYYIEHFNFKKAYCKLHIKYRPSLELFIRCMYPFRALLKYIDFCGPIHYVLAVLNMEEICRADREVKVCTD